MGNKVQESQRVENVAEIMIAVKTAVHDGRIAVSEDYMTGIQVALRQTIDPLNLDAIDEVSGPANDLKQYGQGLAMGHLLGFAHNVGSVQLVEETR